MFQEAKVFLKSPSELCNGDRWITQGQSEPGTTPPESSRWVASRVGAYGWCGRHRSRLRRVPNEEDDLPISAFARLVKLQVTGNISRKLLLSGWERIPCVIGILW